MKEHCYWPLVSDLNNVLSHKPVADKFMEDNHLLKMWFEFLSMFQGMNVNQRELSQHIEFEPNTYYAAFSAELEASAYPMWALVSHLHGPDSVALNQRVLTFCLKALQEWLDAVNYTHPNVVSVSSSELHARRNCLVASPTCSSIFFTLFFSRATAFRSRSTCRFIGTSRYLCARLSDSRVPPSENCCRPRTCYIFS